MADDRVRLTRRMHENPERSWTVPLLAKEAALSRSTFFERFRLTVAFAPMEYLFLWRMALAKEMQRRKKGSVAKAAERVGYSSARTFTIAFTRHVGQPPERYGRDMG